MLLCSGFTNDRKWAALALANGLEALEISRTNGQHITFLRLVAPDLMRRHARFIVGNGAQIEDTATPSVIHQLWEGVGQTTGADVVDKADRVVLAQLPAAVDDLLAAALHFRVFALHGGKIQIR